MRSQTERFLMTRPTIQTALVAASAAALVSGCAQTHLFEVSVPQAIPAGSAGHIQEDQVRLDLDGFSLTVQFQNFRGRGVEPPKPLAVWIGIDARDGYFELDPKKVFLITEEKSVDLPTAYVGPGIPWKSPRAVGNGCGPRRYSLGWGVSKVDVSADDLKKGNPAKGVFKPFAWPVMFQGGPVAFQGTTCFMFFFDVASSPDRAFVLSLKGISRNDKMIDVPDIAFRRGSIQRFVAD